MDLRLHIYLDIIRIPLILVVVYNALSVPVLAYERLAFLNPFFSLFAQWLVLIFLAAWTGMIAVKKCKEAGLSFVGPTKSSMIAGMWLGLLGGVIGGFLGALMTVEKGVTVAAMIESIKHFVVPGIVIAGVVAVLSARLYLWNTRFG